jgi:hypothetical protein
MRPNETAADSTRAEKVSPQSKERVTRAVVHPTGPEKHAMRPNGHALVSKQPAGRSTERARRSEEAATRF